MIGNCNAETTTSTGLTNNVTTKFSSNYTHPLTVTVSPSRAARKNTGVVSVSLKDQLHALGEHVQHLMNGLGRSLLPVPREVEPLRF